MLVSNTSQTNAFQLENPFRMLNDIIKCFTYIDNMTKKNHNEILIKQSFISLIKDQF